jgi:hypothetical protein
MSRWPGKYIYVTRNGKDVLVSYFHFSKMELGFRGTLQDFFERFMKGEVDCGSWFAHVAGWRAHANDPNILFLNYEDLVSDLESCIKKIAVFVRREIPCDKYREIIDRSSFAFMKQHESKFDHIHEVFWESGWCEGGFIRQGKVGEGDRELTSEMITTFERVSNTFLVK